ncbi:MAG: hypothetical protein V3V62_00270 [bacterium]
MTTDELRRILKVFGITVTDFAEEAQGIQDRAARLATASAEEAAELLRDLCDQLADIEEKTREAVHAIEEIKRDLLARVGEAARARAGGGA